MPGHRTQNDRQPPEGTGEPPRVGHRVDAPRGRRPRQRRAAHPGRPSPRLSDFGPRPVVYRKARGQDPQLSRDCVRSAGARRFARHDCGGATFVARFPQGAAPVHPRRIGSQRISAHHSRRARIGRTAGGRTRARRRERRVESATPQASLGALLPRRKSHRAGQPRALHPQPPGRWQHPGASSGERPGHRRRARAARVLGRLGRPWQRLGGSGIGRPQGSRARATQGGVL